MHLSHQPDILFCQQYSLHLLYNETNTNKIEEELATRFINQYPLTSTSITAPKTWSIEDKDINCRFQREANQLLQPQEATLATALSKMFSVQRLAYFFAAGLLGTVVFQGASAMPTDALSAQVERSMDIHFKGQFVDAMSGEPFDLYVDDASLDPATAFSNYLTGLNTTQHLHKRSWYDCKHLTNLQTFGCNTAHGFGGFLSATGAGACGSYLGTLMKEAFNGKRDNQNPRSVCLNRNGDNLCVSWATYDTAALKAGEASDITNYSIDCAKSGGSAEFKTVMNDNGILFICVSDRASGCGQSVC